MTKHERDDGKAIGTGNVSLWPSMKVAELSGKAKSKLTVYASYCCRFIWGQKGNREAIRQEGEKKKT